MGRASLFLLGEDLVLHNIWLQSRTSFRFRVVIAFKRSSAKPMHGCLEWARHCPMLWPCPVALRTGSVTPLLRMPHIIRPFLQYARFTAFLSSSTYPTTQIDVRFPVFAPSPIIPSTPIVPWDSRFEVQHDASMIMCAPIRPAHPIMAQLGQSASTSRM